MGEDITKRFDAIEVDSVGQMALVVVREQFKDLVLTIETETVPGRAQSIAFTALEEAHRCANRAIAEANGVGS